MTWHAAVNRFISIKNWHRVAIPSTYVETQIMTPEENSPDEKIRYWMLRAQEAERLMKEVRKAFEALESAPASILKPPYVYGDAPLYSTNQYPPSTKALGQQTGIAAKRPINGKTSTP